MARVHGGQGGFAYGAGFAGGNGGISTLSAHLTGGQNWQRLDLATTAGRGGNGWIGANGGDGGAAKFGFQPGQLTSSTSENYNQKTLWLNVTGGAGGNSQNGNGGIGGTSRVNLGSVIRAVNTENVSRHLLTLVARAGSGGKATSTGAQAANGGRGAVSFFHTTDTITLAADNETFDANFYSGGGNGGSALGRRGTGNGGAGGAAGIRGQQVIEQTSSRDYGIMDVFFRGAGGHGGHAQGTGIAGNGGDANFDNNFKLIGDRGGRLNINLYGGDGGWGVNNGFGGDAIVNVNEAFDTPNEIVNQQFSLNYNLVAVGGRAGKGVAPARAAHGGHGRIEATETDSRTISIGGRAWGGQGNWGRSGDAYISLVGNIVEGETPGAFLTSNLLAVASHNTDWNVRAAHGTNSDAMATATTPEGNARARTQAWGGWGFRSSGHARSVSVAEATEHAWASSISHTFGDRDNDTNNYSSSHSTATADSLANANASALSNGK